jgi:hypothetical protein
MVTVIAATKSKTIVQKSASRRGPDLEQASRQTEVVIGGVVAKWCVNALPMSDFYASQSCSFRATRMQPNWTCSEKRLLQELPYFSSQDFSGAREIHGHLRLAFFSQTY